MKTFLKKYILYIALIQSIVATLGSLYLSEICGFTPCKLCWYQRVFMYPLIVVLAVGIVENNKNLYKYVLPLSVMGMGLAIYHNLLYYGFLTESVIYCTAGVSCTTKYIEWFGFITIPLLSLLAFIIITILMLVHRKINKL
jgi:disulfide bond formation protein DsbB